MLGRYRARSESLLTYALRRLLPSLCVALLMAAPSAHAAGPVTPEVEVMGWTELAETSGAINPVVAANPLDPSQVLATSTSPSSNRSVAVVRSFDGGTSWAGLSPPQYRSDPSPPNLPVAAS